MQAWIYSVLHVPLLLLQVPSTNRPPPSIMRITFLQCRTLGRYCNLYWMECTKLRVLLSPTNQMQHVCGVEYNAALDEIGYHRPSVMLTSLEHLPSIIMRPLSLSPSVSVCGSHRVVGGGSATSF